MKRVIRPGPLQATTPTLVPGFQPQETRAPALDLWVSPYSNAGDGRVAVLKNLFLESEGSIRKKKNNLDLKLPESNVADGMQTVTRPYILLGQCFALIPVRGIMSNDPRDLIFTWQSRRVMYVLAVLVLATGVAVLQMSSSIILYGLNYRSVDDLISILLTVIQISIFLGHARSWPGVMIEWAKVEGRMKHFEPIVSLKRKVNYYITAFCLGTVVLVITRIMGPLTMMQSCSDNILDLLKLTFIAKYVTLLSLIGYSFGKMLVIVGIFLHQNLLMVYDELTITVLAYCLYIRFKQLNEQLSRMNKQICRFQMQATHDEIAITGCNFFSLNRSFMLTVAGTIATYEIVLLQFNSLNDNNGPSRNMTNMCSRVLRLSLQ